MDWSEIISKLDYPISIDTDQLSMMGNLLEESIWKRGDILKRSPSATRSILFVSAGLMQVFVRSRNETAEKQHRVTLALLKEGDFCILPHSRGHFIEAFTDAHTFIMAIDDREQANMEGIGLSRFLIEVSAVYQERMLEQQISLGTKTVNERYQDLIQKFGNGIHHIPNYCLASYLCISPKHFGRLKSAFLRR